MFFGSFLNRFIFAFSCYSSLLLCFFCFRIFPLLVCLFGLFLFCIFFFFLIASFCLFLFVFSFFFLVFLFVVEMVGGGEGGVGASCSVCIFSLVLFESFCVSFAPSLS